MRSSRVHGWVATAIAALVGIGPVGPAAPAAPASTSSAATSSRVSASFARDAVRLPTTATYEAVIRFRERPISGYTRRLAPLGLTVVAELRVLPLVIVRGPLASVVSLASATDVAYIEPNAPLRYLGDTAIWATRVGVVRHPVSGGPFRAPGGAALDGSGVGVAVIDSGVDAGHPDLVNRVVTNYKSVLRRDFGDLSTDISSGHGTHVSGIVAGDGTASQGHFTGVAPGSSLHVFSSGEVLSVAFALQSFEKLYDSFDSFVPRVRIVNNSWGNPAGRSYDPDGSIETLVRQLVQEKGAVVVFAAGNSGGDGSEDLTSGYCKDPTPGVICVANYDDDESGDRDFALDSSSSRAKQGDATKYPDISAPGSFITSTFRPISGALYGSLVFPAPAWAPNYGDAGGTSMATPHVSGIAALLVQANPSLTPAAVEDILLDTAHKFTDGGPYETDPQNAGETTSFDKGAGLADAVAALTDPRVGLTGLAQPSPTSLLTGDAGDSLFGAADIVSASVLPMETGIEYSVTVGDADARPPRNVGLRVFANIDGKARRTTVDLLPDGTVAPVAAESPDDTATAEAATAVRNGDTVTFFVSHAELDDPPPGAPVHNVWFASYIGVVHDVAPSPAGSAVPRTPADLLLRPLYVPPFTT